MTIKMNAESYKKVRPGVALLIVLFIVMAITILSLGFVSRSDVELACGQNMLLRTQMDYLAESGLEHARGLILNPQDVNNDYWDQPRTFQLMDESNDHYQVNVSRDPTDRCNYTINCNAYRLEGLDKTGQSSLRAVLRIDPCIAYWVGTDTIIPSPTFITGDIYCGGILTNNSNNIDGDAFAIGTITGTITGRKNESVTSSPVVWPNLSIGTSYYIGSTLYSAELNLPALSSYPSENNPAGVRYCIGDVNMLGGVTINGTLVVAGNLTIEGTNIITAVKNFPALVVDGQVVMKDGGSLQINGLAQIEQQITADPNTTNASISVTGGLFIAKDGITSDKVNITIIADPVIASIETWPSPGTPNRWSSAAGAFFRSISRPPIP
jgi:putative component of membrane protein insertase Oxa1/YidC/SpoIIIJ protein YidD